MVDGASPQRKTEVRHEKEVKAIAIALNWGLRSSHFFLKVPKKGVYCNLHNFCIVLNSCQSFEHHSLSRQLLLFAIRLLHCSTCVLRQYFWSENKRTTTYAIKIVSLVRNGFYQIIYNVIYMYVPDKKRLLRL